MSGDKIGRRYWREGERSLLP